MVWIAPPRVGLRAICTFLVEQGFTHVTSQVVEKIHFVPEVESFLLFNLWSAVADLYEKREEERANILTRLREDAAETLNRFASGTGLRHPMRANVVTARID